MSKLSGYSTVSKVGVFATLLLALAVMVLSPSVFGSWFSFESERWVLLGLGLSAGLLGGLRSFVAGFRALGSKTR